MDSSEHEPSYYEVALTNRQVVIGFVALLACVFTAFLAGVWLGRDAAPAAAEQVAEAAQPDGAAAAEGRRGRRMPRLTFFSESPAPEGEEARRGGGGRRKAGDEEPEAAAAPREGAPVEPAAPPARASGAASETLRETLEAEMAAHRDEPAPAPAAGPEAAAEPGTGAERPPAPASGMPVVPGQRVHRDVAAGGTSPAPAAPTAASAATPAPAKAPAPAAKAPAPAPKAPAAAAPAAAPFWIQVYSSGNEPRAREIAASLARRGFGVRVLEAGATFRVRVGPYANRDLAQASAERLRREQKLDTWVTDQP